MIGYVQNLRKLFSEQGNDEYAVKMSQYMKNHFVFFGINSPLRTTLFKQFRAENESPQYNALREAVLELWLEPERELQYCAIELLERCKKEWTEDMIHLFEELIVTKSWWDSVDGVAPLVGLYFKKFPHQTRPITEGWMNSENMWLQRVCVIFQLTYRKETDTALMFDYMRRLCHSKAFFIQKAIGWALRQHARTDADLVRQFVETTKLAPLSKREALKHIG